VIGPARVVVRGRTYRSNPLTVHVRGGAGAVAPGQPSPPATDPTAPPDDEGKPPEPGEVTVDDDRMVDGAQFDPEAFIRTVADRVDPYVGEQVTATVYLYVRGGIRSAPVVSREPTTVGFWTHDLLPPQRTLDSTEQVVQGVPFQVYQLRRWALFPLRDGDLTIGAAELSVQTGSFFDMFRGPRELQRTGVPVTLHVRPLPPGPRPAVVGDFAVQASLDRTQVATGDAVTLTVQVQARRGNVRDARIELPAIDGLRALPPQTTDQVESPHDTVGGVRRIEWLIIPERAGTYRLPALGVDVFDPASGRYTRAESVPLTLTAAGNAVTPPPEPASPDAEDGAESEEEPRFGPVHTSSELERLKTPISSEPWYPWAVALGPTALLALFLFSRIRRRLDRRRLATTPARVVRSARKRLAGARAMAEASDPTAFYGEIARVLQAVLEARLGGPVGGFTHRELHAHLGARGMEEDLARRVVEELEGCDYARFSAAGVARAEMESCTDRVQAIVERLDRFAPRAVEEPS
jgi:hypothetical protein